MKDAVPRGALAFVVVTALVFPLVLGLAMTRDLSHDEHQHVAAGALLAREGLLPYRDFPHFHTPYLAFIYAALFSATDHLLRAARLFTVACSSATIGVLGSVAWSLFRPRGRWMALLICASTVLLYLSAGVFGQTTGRAWNHEPALLFTVLAFVAHASGIRRMDWRWLAASGLLLGVAMGLRITVAPLIAPFGLALILFTANPRLILAFSAGTIVGCSGFLWLFIVAPERTFFGLFGFSQANIAYRFDSGDPRTMTLLKKLRYFWKEIVRWEIPLFAFALLPFLGRGLLRRVGFEILFIAMLLPFLLMGSLAPSPLYSQYFQPFVPFLLLAGLHGLVSIPAGTLWFRRALWIEAGLVIASVMLGRVAYREFRELVDGSDWTATGLHAAAREWRDRVPPGPVLTLAPIYPLEAGLPIYPALSTGPFAWRSAPYVEPGKAARLGLLSPATLETALEATPPAAILLGFEAKQERALGAYALQHGYQRVSLAGRHELWLRPQ